MTVPADELRAWAEGDYPTEAAVELLIRAKGGRFARASCPWIEPLRPSSPVYRVDWDRLHEESGVHSGGERRFLNIAISMGSPDHPVNLNNNLAGLDDELLLLMLAATAHATGRPRFLAPAPAVVTSPGWDQRKRAQSLPGRQAGSTHPSPRTSGSVKLQAVLEAVPFEQPDQPEANPFPPPTPSNGDGHQPGEAIKHLDQHYGRIRASGSFPYPTMGTPSSRHPPVWLSIRSPYSPLSPLIRSPMRSAWPLCRAYYRSAWSRHVPAHAVPVALPS